MNINGESELDLNKLVEAYCCDPRKHRPNYNTKDDFLPCPFCRAKPHIRVEDDEGNDHTWDPTYEANPWSGLWYVIEHSRDMSPRKSNARKNIGDIPWNKKCLIATECMDWYGLGSVPNIGGSTAVFKSREAAVRWWNKMVKGLRS